MATRDVLIRIGAELKAARTDPFKTLAGDATRTEKVIADRVQGMNAKLSEIGNIRGGISKGFLKSLGIDDIDKELTGVRLKLEDTFSKISKGGATPELLRTAQLSVERLGETTERASQQMVGNFSNAGAAAVGLVRGFALLGASGDKDLQKALKNLALIEGVIQSLKGGFSVITGLVAGFQSLTNVISAASVARSALAATAVASTGAITAETGATITLDASLTKLTATQVANTAATAAQTKAFIALAAAKKLAGLAFVGGSTLVAGGAAFAGMFPEATVEFFQKIGAFEDVTNAQKGAGRAEKALQNQLRLRTSREANTRVELDVAGEAAGGRLERRLEQAALGVEHQQGLTDAARELLTVEQQIDIVKQAQATQTEDILANLKNNRGEVEKERFALSEQEKFTRNILDLEKQRIEATKKRNNEIVEGLRKQKEQLDGQADSLERIIQSEKSRLEGLKESFGALSALDRASTKAALQRVAAGEDIGNLSEEERRRVQQFAPTKFKEFALGVSDQEGFGALLAQIGEESRLQQAQTEKQQVAALSLELQNQIEMTVKVNEETLSNLMAERLGPLFSQLEIISQKVVDLKRLEHQRKLNQSATTG